MSEITLKTTVTVPDGLDSSQRCMYEQMANIMGRNFETFVEKNLSYSNSFLLSGIKRYLSDPSRYPTPEAAILDDIWTRNGDKRERFYEQAIGGGTDFVGEDIDETAGDASVYWAMCQLVALHGKEMIVAEIDALSDVMNNGEETGGLFSMPESHDSYNLIGIADGGDQ